MGVEVYPPAAIGRAWQAAGSDETAFPLELPPGSGPDLPAEMAALIAVLARPQVRVDGLHHDLRVVAGSAAGVAALASQNSDGIRLRAVQPESLAAAVIEALPPTTRGTLASLAVPTDELGPRGATLDHEPLRSGTLSAAVRTSAGTLRRSNELAWFDLDSGRYLRRTRRDHDGREWTVIGPADAATLRQHLAALIGGLTVY
jgi:ESAT-6 protein secretion system EspG family protein